MGPGEYEIVQIKRESESNVFDEYFDRSSVTSQTCQIGIFSESGNEYDVSKSGRYYRSASVKYEEQDEKYGTVEMNIEDSSTNKCKAEQMKIEDDMDIHYEDVKSEIDEKKPGECGLNEVCNENIVSETHCECVSDSMEGEDKTQNVMPSFLCRTTGKVRGKTSIGKTPIHCKICSKSFTRLDYLKYHERIHTGEKPFHCKICSKAFVKLSHMKEHERIHTEGKRFHCKNCSKAFTTSSYLKVHERIHTGEKPFHCKICSKTFTRSSRMKEHERIHTDEKPFHCKNCSKAFTTSSYLKVHERIHTGEKLFQCKICSKDFAQLSNLKVHERIHTGEKPYHCRICSKAFAQGGTFKAHERIHTGEKLYHC